MQGRKARPRFLFEAKWLLQAVLQGISPRTIRARWRLNRKEALRGLTLAEEARLENMLGLSGAGLGDDALQELEARAMRHMRKKVIVQVSEARFDTQAKMPALQKRTGYETTRTYPNGTTAARAGEGDPRYRRWKLCRVRPTDPTFGCD